MRQIMFSTSFPATHPRKGEPTRFVEYIWSGLADEGYVMDDIDFATLDVDFHVYYNGDPKVHTIRAGERWKVGYEFVGKVWSGKPYRSKTITVTPVLKVEKLWKIEINFWQGSPALFIDGKRMPYEKFISDNLAKNDGLSTTDFVSWFNKPFSGQIICWNKKIEY